MKGVHTLGVARAITARRWADLGVTVLLQLCNADTKWTAREASVGGEDAEYVARAVAALHGTLRLGLTVGHREAG